MAKSTKQSETRERLLDAAGPIFAEKGLRRVTVREICEQAGVNIAAINYHFGDKENLYVEAVRRARELRAQRYPFPPREVGESAASRLHAYVETILRRMLKPDAPWQTRLLMREILQPTKACQALVEDYFRPDFEMLMEIVRDLLPPNPAAAQVRQVAFSVMGQCVMYRVAGSVVERLVPPEELESEFGIEQLARHIASFSVAACRGWPTEAGGEECVRTCGKQ